MAVSSLDIFVHSPLQLHQPVEDLVQEILIIDTGSENIICFIKRDYYRILRCYRALGVDLLNTLSGFLDMNIGLALVQGCRGLVEALCYIGPVRFCPVLFQKGYELGILWSNGGLKAL